MKITEGITYDLTENEINILKSAYDIMSAIGEALYDHVAVSYRDLNGPIEVGLNAINIVLDYDNGEFSHEREIEV